MTQHPADRRTAPASADPVADVLVDFQSVMGQFLQLQTDVFSAFANRRARTIAAEPVLPTPAAPAAEAAPQPVAHDAAPPVATLIDDASVFDDSGVSDPPDDAAVATIDHAAFSRYTLTVRDRPLRAVHAGLAHGRAIVLTDDGRGIASRIADLLRGSGHRVAIIRSGQDAQDEADVFFSALDTAAEAERVLTAIAESCGRIGALIHLMPLSQAPEFDTLDAASWWTQLSSETRTLFLLARSVGTSLEEAAHDGGAAFLAATSMGGTFGTTAVDDSMLPSQGGVVGFTKCVAIEWPDVRVRAVDLDPAQPADTLAEHIIDELWAIDAGTEVGYVNGRRISLDAVRTPASLDKSFALPSDSVILATGGARGITAEVCLELAERYQPTFVLVGQSPLPAAAEPADTARLTAPADLKRVLTARLQAGGSRVTPAMVEKAYRQLLKEREVRETLSRLSAAGARTHYVQIDVTNEQAFGALIDDVYATYGRLDGVIHGAGIIEDKLVRQKSPESFDRVLRTKAISSFVLSRHLRPDSLRFLIFFSSVAGRFGNRGQADYAAANEVVSKLAVMLQRRWPVRVCSIAWAPWDKLGMVSPELKREFARRGVELLSPAAGRQALWREIQQDPGAGAEIVVGGHTAGPLTVPDEPEPLPLLKNATRDTSAVDAVRFVRSIDPTVDVYLNDHRLDGRPVLPLAFATELMAEAAQAAWPDLRVVALRDLQLLKGIVVDGAAVPITITVRSAVHSTDNGLTEVDVDISTPAAKPPMRYRSVVQLAARDRETPVFDPPAWPLAPLAKPVSEAYRDWTFHGPMFQRITDIAGIGVDALLGTIYSPSAAPAIAGVGRPAWIIDPFVFDAALQLLLMWSRARNDKTALPSRFRMFSRFGSLSDQPLTTYVAVESLAGGHALRSTVHFVDHSGRVLALLEAMEASCTNALNRLAAVEGAEGSRRS